MSYHRSLAIDLPPGQSAFLWGARQTGKSTVIPYGQFLEELHAGEIV